MVNCIICGKQYKHSNQKPYLNHLINCQRLKNYKLKEKNKMLRLENKKLHKQLLLLNNLIILNN